MLLTPAESRELELVRPDLHRVITSKVLTPRQRVAQAAWERLKRNADSDTGRIALVAQDMGISDNAARQLLNRIGLVRQTTFSRERQQVKELLKAGKSIDEAREATNAHDVTIEMAIIDYAAELVAP